MDEFLTTNEVAALVRTSPETVRYWRHVRKGPRSFKAGRRVLYARTEVNAWLHRLQQEDVTFDPTGRHLGSGGR